MKDFLAPVIGVAVAAIVAFVLVPVGAEYARKSQPASNWLELGDIRVSDTSVGESPIMSAKRRIKSNFRAELIVSLRKVEAHDNPATPAMEADWVTVCDRVTVHNYRPESQPPDVGTLDYWTGVPPNIPCVPTEPGPHIVTVWVEIMTESGPRIITAESNVFQVTK